MRNENVMKIFKKIHKMSREGSITRKELTRKIDFSSATVSNHVNTLLEKGYLLEERKGASTGGRKPFCLSVNANKAYIFAVDIRVDGITVELYNLNLKPEITCNLSVNIKSFTSVIKSISCKIKEILRENSININKVIGIGVAVPGLIDKGRNRLVFAPNLEWQEGNIAGELKKHFAVPVLVENDANSAVVGEKSVFCPGARNIACIFIKEGVGCGVIINNRLYRGTIGNAGEFGHMIVDYSDSAISCYCGSKGCWETVASESYIVRRCQEELGINNKKINKNTILSLVESSEKARDIIREIGYNIGIGAVNIVNILSPEYLIIGGGITRYKELISDEIQNAVENRTLKTFSQDTKVVFSELNDQAISVGVANLIFENYFEIE